MESSTASNCSAVSEAQKASKPHFTPPIKSEQLPVGKKLTKDLVLSKSKGGSLIEIKKIVVWGQKITDCSIVTEIPELEVASMNANKISSLEHFGQCPNLRELFLRNNCIDDLNEIFYLKDLPNLQVLWLAGNPCTKNPKYRHTIIRNLEQLQKLDDNEISPEERASSEFDGLLFEQPPVRPTAAEPTAATDPLVMDLAQQMQPAADIKLKEAAASPPQYSPAQAPADRAAAGVAESVDRGSLLAESSKQTPAPIPDAASAAGSEASAPSSSTLWTGRSGSAAALGVGAPLPRYALVEVRTAVLRLIRLLDQESLQLVMHTARARLQEGAGAADPQQQQQQSAGSDISPSFFLDNL